MTPTALEACVPGRGAAVIRMAVELATTAADQHAGAVALSLGSFGSTLKPGQEYAGVYPPPFGPSPSVSSPQSAGTRGGQPAPPPSGTADLPGTPAAQQDTACASPEPEHCEDALYAFHLDRLRAYRSSTDFGELAWLAFETVPNLAEIRAIRRAMVTLRNEGRDSGSGVVGPSRGEERADHAERQHEERAAGAEDHRMAAAASEGTSARVRSPAEEGSEARAEASGGVADLSRGVFAPQLSLAHGSLRTQPTRDGPHGSGRAQPQFWISSAFPSGQLGAAPNGPHTVAEWLSALFDGGSSSYAIPDGVGVNCTNPTYLPAILDEMEARVPAEVRKRTMLVVYPDGGCVYDPVTKDWTEKTGTPGEWARGVLDVLHGREWEGTIVGGCCKTGPEEIAALRRALDAQS